MAIKFFKIKKKETKKIEELACFYKYIIIDDQPSIPLSSMLERVFAPWNKKYDDYASLYKFLNDVMPSLGHI